MSGVYWVVGIVLLAAIACRALVGGGAAGPEGGFVKRSVVVEGTTYPYQVFVPRPARAPSGTGAGGRPPVILFLHGGGERGTDGERQTQVGLGPVVRAQADTFPALVIFPQAPPDSLWHGPPARAALAALEAAMAEHGADPDRVYLTGISMGGYGSFELALAQPERFAALVSVCGGLRPPPERPHLVVTSIPATEPDPYAYAAARLAMLPIWLFHGEKDDIVPPSESRLLAASFEKAGAPVRYTEYPGVNHGSWDRAYAEPGLWEWLWAQRRGH